MKQYDFLIVGSGLFGSVCAYELNKRGYSTLVIDKRSHIGGNIYTENIDGINIHKYGPHIFHTSEKWIWTYINQFAKFNNFINSPLAFNTKYYSLPFNLLTFKQLWSDVIDEKTAREKIENEKIKFDNPKNLEEQALSLVGKTIYETLIKEYTEKQWGKSCDKLPPEIIKRIPLRFEENNNYFADIYQGIPIGGYTQIIEKLLNNSDVILNCQFDNIIFKGRYKNIIYTGSIDEFYNYIFGELDYRSLLFTHTKTTNCQSNIQKSPVVNYTTKLVPYTRSFEHKQFENSQSNISWITYEFPISYKKGLERYYVINDNKNNELYKKYLMLRNKNVFFGGRLGLYKYLDMDDTIQEAINLIKKLESEKII